MGEAEFDTVLDAVRSSMSADGDDARATGHGDPIIVPPPANDNDGPWPHLPFPDGWVASC